MAALPDWLTDFACDALVRRVAHRRLADETIGDAGEPYLMRWHLIPKTRWLNVYLHLFCRSDDERALHDHPWASLGILLSGPYLEHLPGKTSVYRVRGSVVFRSATATHRVQLTDGPVWTLFLTGPKTREWGFHCPRGWRHWRKFDERSDGRVSRGCE